jgi:hypothetical protein
MLSTIRISKFRAFRELTVEKLARVNLFVGTNNAGKTSLLDAVELLAGGGEPYFLYRIARRIDDRSPDVVDIRQLFHGRSLAIGNGFSIGSPDRRSVVVEIEPIHDQLGNELSLDELLHPHFDDDQASIAATRYLEIRVSELEEPYTWDFSPSGMLPYRRMVSRKSTKEPILHLGTAPMEAAQASDLWGRVVLTPQEGWVTEMLRVIEPNIERIAFGAEDTRGTFFIKLVGQTERIPLGSMGDGIRRLLALSLHLAQCAKGTFLMDEIDTGLHYSVMVDMWRMVIEAANRLDIQIFATTHSIDCIHALARLHEKLPDITNDVLLHRIDRGAPTAMTYTAEQLRIAAEHHMEVR